MASNLSSFPACAMRAKRNDPNLKLHSGGRVGILEYNIVFQEYSQLWIRSNGVKSGKVRCFNKCTVNSGYSGGQIAH